MRPRVWCSASRRTQLSGGTPEIARETRALPRMAGAKRSSLGIETSPLACTIAVETGGSNRTDTPADEPRRLRGFSSAPAGLSGAAAGV
jgi:hypothetical protein